MEHIEYELNVPPQGANGDKMFFVQIDAEKCIGCDTCQEYCPTGAIVGETGLAHKVAHVEPCINCGQCLTHCPENAIYEVQTWVPELREKLKDKNVKCIAMPAPSVRYALGEAFGLAPGSVTTGKMLSALKALGFAHCWDTEFAADVTIWEEASEFVARLGEKKDLPQFTSCCPGWVRFVKTQFPAYVSHLSTAKSPQQMFGAVAKSYFAQKLGVDPHDIFVVSIMPCTAKKSEAALPTMRDACGDADVDVVLTTREIVRMFRGEQINPAVLDETPFDSPLGSGTGAAVIFGATGGVMDAALRSAYYLVTGKNPDPDAFRDIRGMDGWKDAKFEIPGAGVVSVAVASGLLNTRKLMTALERGEVRYDFVEIMACPGGCAGGGGQPIHDGVELAEKRGSVLWSIDKAAPCRFSHENPDVRELYRDYLKKPLSDVSHHLLHTDHQAWKMPSQK